MGRGGTRFQTHGELAAEHVKRRGALYFGDVDAEVRRRLAALPEDRRAAFALACAERAMRHHLGLPEEERQPFTLGWATVLEAIREALTGRDPAARSRVEQAMAEFHASPYDHSDGQDGPPDADEDAAACAIYAAQCFLGGSADDAAWGASRMIDIAFSIAEHELGLDSNDFEWDADADPPSPLAQETLHPAVQAELRRQLDDLDRLATTDAAALLA